MTTVYDVLSPATNTTDDGKPQEDGSPDSGGGIVMDCDYEELIRKIELILIMEGQHDKRFKLGETIRYAPYEVKEILRKHKDEILTLVEK